jgi:D-amino-acid oxidase
LLPLSFANSSLHSAGIIGLTSALRLQHVYGSKCAIIIVARDFPSETAINYASPWAGAHYRPIPAITPQLVQENKFAKITYKVLREQSVKEPASGINFMKGIDYIQTPVIAYLEQQGGYGDIENFRVLDKEDLPHGVVWGAEYDTWCLNPPVYCQYLLRKFILRGGRTRQHELENLAQAFTVTPNVETVVNCSGLGFGDPATFIIRGKS